MKTKQSTWIWYPGDFEIYHGMLQNFQREERGYGWPAYWKMDDWRKNIKFSRTFKLEKEEEFLVHGYGDGHVLVNDVKYPLEKKLACGPGKVEIVVCIGNMTGLPCIYVEGETIVSDDTWTADDFLEKKAAGVSSLYTEKEQNPNKVLYCEEVLNPVSVKEKNGGILMDFGRMVDGTLKLELGKEPVLICYGESEKEALDIEMCYYKEEQANTDTAIRKRAFRYLFFPGCTEADVKCQAIHQYVPIPVKASFSCDDEELNKIWEVAEETYRLCSGLFFIDGIKRDRWIWSGDAYQSYFVNPYLFFDDEITKRTILALRGNTDIQQHINTIVDYSLLWLISIEDYYNTTRDARFVEQIYEKMESLMALCHTQCDEKGFIYGREQDWIFVDWCTMDKEGTVCAEQILLLKCLRTMAHCAKILGRDGQAYADAAERLYENIMKYFWDEEKGAFIDCYESGKRHVTRHANIFAILFDLADEEKTEKILEGVLLNPEIDAITTPYFKFFEMDALAKAGRLDLVFAQMKGYWGSMLKEGAVTFWEEYTPGQTEEEKYSMYGDPYGKSLCHAWGASPIYLLGRYYVGVRPLSAGYETFEVCPQLAYFKSFNCVIPVKDGSVWMEYQDGCLRVKTDKAGGVLTVNGRTISLENGYTHVFEIQ